MNKPVTTEDDDMASAIAKFIDDQKCTKQEAINLAGELVGLIRVNSMWGRFKEATHEQVEECLAPFVARLRRLQSPGTPYPSKPEDGGEWTYTLPGLEPTAATVFWDKRGFTAVRVDDVRQIPVHMIENAQWVRV